MSMVGMERTISSINKGISEELDDQNKYIHNEKVVEVEDE
jgi:hypothetical protein